MTINIQNTLTWAQKLAKNVGNLLLQHQQKAHIIAYKDRQDIVTTADLEAEKTIIQAIKTKYPGHSIYSEEQGSDQIQSDYRWIIDPLDGSKEFVRGIPQWNTCFALEYQNQAIVSVVYHPPTNELYAAAKGLGAFLNQIHLTLSPQKNLDQSFVFAYLPTYKDPGEVASSNWHRLHRLSRRAYRVRGIAEEALALCWVASGKIEAAINLGPQPKWHDIIPGLFIAQTAGATITDTQGNLLKTHDSSQGFAVSNGYVHQQLLHALS